MYHYTRGPPPLPVGGRPPITKPTAAMRRHTALSMLLAALVMMAMLSWQTERPPDHASLHPFAWSGFLVGLPLVLIALTLLRVRWGFMAAVMYGTIGLALDIATLVQEVTRADSQWAVLAFSTVTGLLNGLVIMLGGSAFLDPASHTTPRAARSPNHRSPFSPK